MSKAKIICSELNIILFISYGIVEKRLVLSCDAPHRKKYSLKFLLDGYVEIMDWVEIKVLYIIFLEYQMRKNIFAFELKAKEIDRDSNYF